MEVAVIDWKNLDSRFVRDEMYENINAPQWVDFSAPDAAIDDESWFCRPDCNHPKKFEDFCKQKTPEAKVQRPAFGSERLPLNERSRRDGALKKRGVMQPIVSPATDMKYGRAMEDSENQNPNYATPPNNKAKLLKETVKSSTEKKQLDVDENAWRKEQPRSLRSTLSAKNLFAGGDILSKVTEFCNELKKLATRPKDKENMGENLIKDSSSDDYGDLDVKEKERKPLLEANKEKNVTPLKSKLQEKQTRKKRHEDTENTPISINVKNIRKGDNVLQIRTCPPTPQCFSANRGASKVPTTPLRTFNSRTMERRGILKELEQSNLEDKLMSDTGHNSLITTATEKEAKPLDVFWFLKPCALSS
ncbi:OLC1v1001531C1 [Oldenlandia corymbosa var. corymbosa]|uniref:OLC1v1001531C1 n=1 Tax=Oldenlandia corymbosa var. corymbosa TaxID=529605 RepID=A0AAV1D8D6_OLDCO|nr:OLC1v1001531C1 [Oldenlandia corymbosa var. corymbosa]